MVSLKRSAAYSAAGQLLNQINPWMSYNFFVEIEGLLVGGFTEVSGINSKISLQEYAEGGQNSFTHQFPTRITYSNLVLSHGLTYIDSLWQWYQEVSQGNVIRKNVTIVLLNHIQLPLQTWTFKAAYPISWQGPRLNALNDSVVAVESFELVHQGIQQEQISS
ncbi:phage tail protein [Nostoc parmelioides]|uniref:Phage tail protein n=1 Tax=Nostoc parmelioides FACHB-3921 TaxID=2692909 RepID=A0ABR8BEN0_9NOSO|nr:phage tail protein [Nostoc parmelioides]MBD2251984.1 phage tail protein [Nostoc parmelioides FACHB-3921]